MDTDYLYCDNYVTCKSRYPLHQDQAGTEARAHARGWHLFHGHTVGGAPDHHVLCPDCVGPRAFRRPPAVVLEGQQELFT